MHKHTDWPLPARRVAGIANGAGSSG